MATEAATLPTLADFPDAEVVGGSILLLGKNMGTLVADGKVEVSPLGQMYLDNKDAEPVPPVPAGTYNPAETPPVTVEGKRQARRVKKNADAIAAKVEPTEEEEAMFAAEDALAAGQPPADPPADPPPAP